MDRFDDEPLPRTASKTLRMDIARMASLEREDRPTFEDHALSPKEHEAISGSLSDRQKCLMYSNSLKKRSLEPQSDTRREDDKPLTVV